MSRIQKAGIHEPKDRIILPLDVPDPSVARTIVEHLSPHVGMFKIGLEFIFSSIKRLMTDDYESAVANLQKLRQLANAIGGSRVFLDGKLNDIPNTVGGASLAISQMGVAWFNVHASAGIESIRKAVANCGSSKVFGVTVLTTIEPIECVSIFGDHPEIVVERFARTILDAGAHGIICSPKELKILRADSEFNDLIIATPGVRSRGSDANDQKRIMTPGEAIIAGADYLVIGRPITGANDPIAAAKAIAEEIRLAEFMCK